MKNITITILANLFIFAIIEILVIMWLISETGGGSGLAISFVLLTPIVIIFQLIINVAIYFLKKSKINFSSYKHALIYLIPALLIGLFILYVSKKPNIPCKDKRITKEEIVGTYTAHDDFYKGVMIISDNGTFKQKVILKSKDSTVLDGNWHYWTFNKNESPTCFGSIENYSIDFDSCWSSSMPGVTPYAHTVIAKGWEKQRILIFGDRNYWEKQPEQ